jgi:hypothetical protein
LFLGGMPPLSLFPSIGGADFIRQSWMKSGVVFLVAVSQPINRTVEANFVRPHYGLRMPKIRAYHDE